MKRFVTLFILIVATPLAASYTEIKDLSTLTIKTPALQKRQEAKIRLDNGLEAYLISDPGAIQSGGALAVEVGSFDDPKDRPGMAHFVEHMLFLGTEKYPQEEDFTRFLDTHGGLRNAFTAADKTVFSFSVDHDAFDGALDRFAQFFSAPLFKASGVARESKAIDEEFCKNLPVEFWRTHHIKKELANQEHPFSQFAIGNRETLHLIKREELIKWYQTHYSANLMHLVILSPKPLEELKKTAAALFSSVPNLEATAQTFSESLLSNKTEKQLVVVSPLRDTQTLELSFELPSSLCKDKASSPNRLLAYILGHEGEFSLLAELKKENLATDLGAGTFDAGRDQGFFTLAIDLTLEGVKHYDVVIERCFQAIARLKQHGLPRYLFDEMQTLVHLEYAYQLRTDVFETLLNIAAKLPEEDLETFPLKTLCPITFDKAKNTALLDLLTPTKCRYTLLADPALLDLKPAKEERWMKTPYALLALDESLIQKWTKARPNHAIGLPAPNKFLPNHLDVIAKEQKSPSSLLPSPTLIQDQGHGSLCYCTDDRFFVPKMAASFHIRTPIVDEKDPASKAMADLYCYALKQSLAQVAYEAATGGISYKMTPSQNGFELTVQGFSEKTPYFTEKVFQYVSSINLEPSAFTKYKTHLARKYFNEAHENVLRQGGEILWTLLYQDYSPLKAKYAALQDIEYKDFNAFCAQLFEQRHIEATVYGNLTDQQTLSLWEQVKSNLPGTIYQPTQHKAINPATFPNKLTPNQVTKSSPLEGNSMILLADCGKFSFANKAIHEILAKGLEEPFFSELRTQKQLGYIVFNDAKEIEGHLYLLFVAQSSGFSTEDLHEAMGAFLQRAKEKLASDMIPEKRFVSLKDSLIWKIKHPAKTPSEMNSVLHQLAYNRDADFSFPTKWIQAVEDLSYDQFIDKATGFLTNPNISIFVAGDSPTPPKRTLKSVAKIKDQLVYRANK